MPLLAQPFDLHQLQAAIPAGRLQRIRPSADDHRRLRRRHAVDDRAGPPRGPHRFAAPFAQNSGEREMHALERPQDADLERGGRLAEGLDHLVGALVPLPALADAAVDDFLQVIRAGEATHVARGNTCPRVALDQHPQ